MQNRRNFVFLNVSIVCTVSTIATPNGVAGGRRGEHNPDRLNSRIAAMPRTRDCAGCDGRVRSPAPGRPLPQEPALAAPRDPAAAPAYIPAEPKSAEGSRVSTAVLEPPLVRPTPVDAAQLLSRADSDKLDALHDEIERRTQTFVGYPCNTSFDYAPLYRFLARPINNLGDPFVDSNYCLNTHTFEREVLGEFLRLTHAPASGCWGYVTNGGTEGNMYGLFLARELLPDGMVYYSEDTHYSVGKVLRCLRCRSIMIRSRPDGSMDLDDLRETVRIHRDVPPVVFANVGTTVKGAIDDVAGIRKIFAELAVHRFYIHVDAALFGMILPFVDDAPAWDFRAGIDSLSISGHKMIGSPIPCGVVLARKANVDRIARSVEYVGTLDTTLSGSRNAVTPLFLWYALRTRGEAGFRELTARCLDTAEYAVQRFNRAGRHAWRHPQSIIPVFDRPSDDIVKRWALAVQGPIAHIVCMEHVTRAQIDRLADEMSASR